jgi:hypothetical protein
MTGCSASRAEQHRRHVDHNDDQHTVVAASNESVEPEPLSAANDLIVRQAVLGLLDMLGENGSSAAFMRDAS